MLEPGEYIVYTRDSIGCVVVDTVVVSTQVSTTTIHEDYFIKIYPNPGKGVFQVSAILNVEDVFVEYVIFTAGGEQVLQGSIAKYNDAHKGEMSLIAYPSGVYYVAFYVGDELLVRRLVKTD